jgi:hypothetical protein
MQVVPFPLGDGPSRSGQRNVGFALGSTNAGWSELLTCDLWATGSQPSRRPGRKKCVLTIGSAVSEQELRRYLDEAHRQLLERDNAYRRHEEELRGRSHHQIEQLRKQLGHLHERLTETEAWAKELEANVHDMKAMQETRAWRLAVRLRSLRSGARSLVGR